MYQQVSTLLFLFTLHIVLNAQASGQAVVTPDGFDSVEGTSSVGAGAPPRFRFQWLYDSLWFPEEPIKITELAFRRNESTLNQEVKFSDLEIALSTQTANLQSRFRDNIGADQETVFLGDLVQPLPVDDSPRPFDIVVPFNSPFHYDPLQGDLLVDFKANQGVNAAPFWDAVPVAQGRAKFSFDTSDGANASPADVLPVVQFTFNPVGLALDCNTDGELSILDANCVDGQDLPELLNTLDVRLGDLNADGTVDMADFLTLSAHYGTAASYTDGDLDLNGRVEFVDFLSLSHGFGAPSTAAVPEPSGSLLAIGLLIVFVRYRRSSTRACRSTVNEV